MLGLKIRNAVECLVLHRFLVHFISCWMNYISLSSHRESACVRVNDVGLLFTAVKYEPKTLPEYGIRHKQPQKMPAWCWVWPTKFFIRTFSSSTLSRSPAFYLFLLDFVFCSHVISVAVKHECNEKCYMTNFFSIINCLTMSLKMSRLEKSWNAAPTKWNEQTLAPN